jgi:hypothetical protein
MAAVIMAGSLRIDPERALAMPCIVINSRDPDLSLSAAASIVVASSLGHDESASTVVDVAKVFPESDKQNEVVLLPWGIGDESGTHSHSHSVSSNTLVRRITVEVRYSGRHGGALLVVVPQSMAEAVQQVQASAVDFGADLAMTTVSSTAASAPGTLHYARCAGVVEVCKQAARPTVDMRRRIIVIHMVCRMPLNAQISLSKVVEDNLSSTLFVLTSEAPASIDSRLSSRAVLCRVPVRSVGSPRPPPEPTTSTSTSSNPMRRTVGAWVNAISSGRSGILDCYETLVGGWTSGAPHLPESPECPPHVPGDVVQALAEADHTLALIRKRGGDLACMRVAVAAVMRHRLREVLSVRPF